MPKSKQRNQSKRTSTAENSKGVRTTNRHPSKITTDFKNDVKILASNIDTLVISLDLLWENQPFFFATLTEAKSLARIEKKDIAVDFRLKNSNEDYVFDVKPTGSRGHEWIILNKEYSIALGNWIKPQSMPSAIISIRSETLWRKGPHDAIKFIINFLFESGAKIQKARISRLDLCVDALFPNTLWSPEILNYAVSRATSDGVRLDETCIHQSHKKLSGIEIGKGKIRARLYDKPLEIIQKSNKTWFYDIWNLPEVPNGFKIIRTEFQIRREVLKEIGIDSIDDLFNFSQNAWAYCTVKWLKFQNHTGKQSHQRESLDWWKIIQNGFNDCPAGNPLIRIKASNADKTRIAQQMLGLLSSYGALDLETGQKIDPDNINMHSAFKAFETHLYENNLINIKFSEQVKNKKAKFQRLNNNFTDGLEKRAELSFTPSPKSIS